MDNVARLANALKMAEKAHATYEKLGPCLSKRVEWPEYYAQWLIDNVHIWSGACVDGKCEYHNHG